MFTGIHNLMNLKVHSRILDNETVCVSVACTYRKGGTYLSVHNNGTEGVSNYGGLL